MTELHLLFQGFSFLLGLVIGSFLNVCIARLPHGKSVVFPRSHCPQCGNLIAFYDNIPVLSYCILRQKCRHCHGGISKVYPLVELLSGAVALLLFRLVIPDGSLLDAAHISAWACFFGFSSLLIVASCVDVKFRIIPDETSIYAVPVVILISAGLQWVGYDGWMGIGWRQSVLGALAGGGFFALVALGALFLWKREALGWGDVKFMALLGAMVGPWPGTLFVMLWGSVLGSLAGLAAIAIWRKRPLLPFAPALSVAAFIYLCYGERLLPVLHPAFSF